MHCLGQGSGCAGGAAVSGRVSEESSANAFNGFNEVQRTVNEFNEPRLRGVSAAENMIYYNIEPFERNAVYVPAE